MLRKLPSRFAWDSTGKQWEILGKTTVQRIGGFEGSGESDGNDDLYVMDGGNSFPIIPCDNGEYEVMKTGGIKIHLYPKNPKAK
jgi:hypothetical protein